MTKEEMCDKPKSNVFDTSRVRELVEMMKDNDISELELRQGDIRIQLKRGSRQVVAAEQPQMVQVPAAVQAAPPVQTAPVAVVDESHIEYIKSPMVGTFYGAANPESPPFVKVGDSVDPEKTVCILEAMKVFNEIQAEISGKIVAILVSSGEPVEYGKPLFKVDTRV